jgi:hypothetical protein
MVASCSEWLFEPERSPDEAALSEAFISRLKEKEPTSQTVEWAVSHLKPGGEETPVSAGIYNRLHHLTTKAGRTRENDGLI